MNQNLQTYSGFSVGDVIEAPEVPYQGFYKILQIIVDKTKPVGHWDHFYFYAEQILDRDMFPSKPVSKGAMKKGKKHISPSNIRLITLDELKDRIDRIRDLMSTIELSSKLHKEIK